MKKGLRSLGRTICAALVCLAFSPAAALASPPPPADFFGISSAGMLGGETELAQIQSLGIHNVRVNLEWAKADPSTTPCEESGPVDWAYYDGVVGRAAEHGIALIADLYGNRMACVPQRFPLPGTQNYADYVLPETEGHPGGFVWQAVRRYGTGGTFWAENPTVPYEPIETWEVWNEPNLPENNPFGVIQPPLYGKLLVDVAAAVHGADPTARVLVGGIYSGAGESAEGFFDWIYDYPWEYTPAQFHGSFTGVGIHPYAISGGGSNTTFGGPEVSEERLIADRAVLDQPRAALGGGSDGEKTLWVTELGWPTEFAATPSMAAITPEVQSADLTATMGWMYEHADEYRIEYAASFVLNDYHEAAGCSDPRCWPQYSGLNKVEFAPTPYLVERPAVPALRSLVATG